MVKKFEFSLLIRITVRYTVIIRRFICFLRKILLNSENIVDDGKY